MRLVRLWTWAVTTEETENEEAVGNAGPPAAQLAVEYKEDESEEVEEEVLVRDFETVTR